MSNTKETHRCCEMIVKDWRRSQCSAKGKYLVDGKWYCGRHNPNKAPTKAQIAAEEERERQRLQYKWNLASRKLCAGFTTEELVKWNSFIDKDSIKELIAKEFN